jgi:hypothetical protein
MTGLIKHAISTAEVKPFQLTQTDSHVRPIDPYLKREIQGLSLAIHIFTTIH